MRKQIGAALLGALALFVVVAGWAGSAAAQAPLEGPWICRYNAPGGSGAIARVTYTLFLRRTSATTAEIYDGYGSFVVIGSRHAPSMFALQVTPVGAFSATPGDAINFTTKTRALSPFGLPPPPTPGYLPFSPSVNQESWLVTNSSPLTFTVSASSGASHLLNVPPGGSGQCHPLR